MTIPEELDANYVHAKSSADLAEPGAGQCNQPYFQYSPESVIVLGACHVVSSCSSNQPKGGTFPFQLHYRNQIGKPRNLFF